MISQVFHKAFVDINEEGSEAAAATVIVGCFPAGTDVLTKEGPRPIETVQAGTEIYSYNFTSGKWVLADVLRQESVEYSGDIVMLQTQDGTLSVTGNHPFFVQQGNSLDDRPPPKDVGEAEQRLGLNGRWVEARSLQVDDLFLTKSGTPTRITDLKVSHGQKKVYNLNVAGFHNYAVGTQGILVHNKGGGEREHVTFRVDHPYIYMIMDNLSGAVLFMGRVTNPMPKE